MNQPVSIPVKMYLNYANNFEDLCLCVMIICGLTPVKLLNDVTLGILYCDYPPKGWPVVRRALVTSDAKKRVFFAPCFFC